LQTELARAADDKLDDLKLKSSLDRSSDNTTLTGKDWFDDRSVEIVRQLLVLTNAKAKVLYPGEVATPLIKLGELAGWSTPSPLGLGVSNTYGPWLAYRALVLTNEPLTPVQNNQPRPTSPCLDCAAPCVDACPGDAVASNSNFNIDKCVSHRALKNSSCAVDCHARNACPVGTEYQYPAQQRAYHMTLALSAMINWTKKS